MATSLKYTNDEYIEDIRAALEDLTVQDPPTRHVLHTKFMPGAYRTLFEGSVGDDDMLHFTYYDGPCQEQHERRKLHEPKLVEPRMDSLDPIQHTRFSSLFIEQIALLRKSYREEDHGRLRISGCFGRLYMFDSLPQPEMTVADFHHWGQKTGNHVQGEKLFRSSFVFREFPHRGMERHLQKNGYELYRKATWHEVYTEHMGNDARYNCVLMLDENGKFVEFCYPPVKWAVFNLKRVDKNLRDIRLIIESVRNVDEETDPAVDKYKDQDLIRTNEDGEVSLKQALVNSCKYIKKVQGQFYQKPSKEASSKMNAGIILQKYMEFKKPNLSGRFTQVKDWEEEVLIQPSMWEYDEFPVDFLNLSTELERYI